MGNSVGWYCGNCGNYHSPTVATCPVTHTTLSFAAVDPVLVFPPADLCDECQAKNKRIAELVDLLEEGIMRIDPRNAEVVRPKATDAWIKRSQAALKEIV